MENGRLLDNLTEIKSPGETRMLGLGVVWVWRGGEGTHTFRRGVGGTSSRFLLAFYIHDTLEGGGFERSHENIYLHQNTYLQGTQFASHFSGVLASIRGSTSWPHPVALLRSRRLATRRGARSFTGREHRRYSIEI